MRVLTRMFFSFLGELAETTLFSPVTQSCQRLRNLYHYQDLASVRLCSLKYPGVVVGNQLYSFFRKSGIFHEFHCVVVPLCLLFVYCLCVSLCCLFIAFLKKQSNVFHCVVLHSFFFLKHTQNQLDKYIKQNNSQFSRYLHPSIAYMIDIQYLMFNHQLMSLWP